MQLSEYDPIDLAKKAGGVQLLPENADYYVEMLRCSALIAALPAADEGLLRVSDHAWRLWINSAEPMLHAPELSGDPHEGLFVAEVPCYGGAYLAIPSDSPQDPFIVECLLEAALHRLNEDHPQFRREVAEIALAGLWISDQCVRRAGLHRQTEPSTTQNGEIRWPSGKAARELEDAVTFAGRDIAQNLLRIGLSDNGLRKLAFAPGDIAAGYTGIFSNPMRRRPLLTAGDRVIVISPTTLLIAVRDAILEAARRFGAESALLDAYRNAIQARVDHYAHLLRWEALGRADCDVAGTTVAESYFQFDSDKVTAVFVVCDDLRNGAANLGDRYWDLSPIMKEIESHIVVVQQSLFDSHEPPREILTLLIVQGVGRPYVLGLGLAEDARTVRAVLSADELRVFTLLNLNDELALWQVARAREQLPKSTSMLHGGFLDHYTLYHNRRKSYYFGDDGTPDFVYFNASGMQSRLEAQRKLDPHWVPFPTDGKYGTVLRLESRPNFPVYSILPSTRTIQLLVEGLPFPVWVVAAETPDARLEDHRHLFFHLADATAFWIWQFTPSLQSLASRSRVTVEAIVIQVQLTRPDAWLTLTAGGGDYGITVTRDDTRPIITVTFGPEFGVQSMLPTNLAERELSRVLLHHLSASLGVPLGARELDLIIDEHAPVGVKRRFSVVEGIEGATMSSDGLPRVRKVQAFDEQVLCDLLGQHLRDSKGYGVGEISSSDQSAVCNESVRFLYEHFRSLIAELSGKELLQQLIGRHESLIADRRQGEVIMATHFASFGQSHESIQDCQNDLMATDRASVASRFLIEFVAAQPPSGSRDFSTSAYDRIIATASEITYYGQNSDSLHYKLSRHSFELLRSGRLALSAPQYETAITDSQ